MFANLLRDCKIITVYKKLFRIHKDVSAELFNQKKAIETGTTTMLELADWMIDNKKVIPLLEYLIKEIEYDPILEADVGTIDESITEMLEDHSKIVSPEGSATTEASKVADATEEELEEGDKGVVLDETVTEKKA